MASSSVSDRVADVFIRALELAKYIDDEDYDFPPTSATDTHGSLPAQATVPIFDPNPADCCCPAQSDAAADKPDAHDDRYVVDENGVTIDVEAFRRFSRFEDPFVEVPCVLRQVRAIAVDFGVSPRHCYDGFGPSQTPQGGSNLGKRRTRKSNRGREGANTRGAPMTSIPFRKTRATRRTRVHWVRGQKNLMSNFCF